jgi:hypothetical protein
MSRKVKEKKKLKEDTIVVNVNIGNDVEAQISKKVRLDADGFAVDQDNEESSVDGYSVTGSCNYNMDPEETYPEHPESAPCNSDSDGFINSVYSPIGYGNYSNIPTSIEDLKNVPEEERIVDDSEDPVVQTVIEMCKKFGVDKTIECLQKIESENPNIYSGLKAAKIKDFLLKVKSKKWKKRRK